MADGKRAWTKARKERNASADRLRKESKQKRKIEQEAAAKRNATLMTPSPWDEAKVDRMLAREGKPETPRNDVGHLLVFAGKRVLGVRCQHRTHGKFGRSIYSKE